MWSFLSKWNTLPIVQLIEDAGYQITAADLAIQLGTTRSVSERSLLDLANESSAHIRVTRSKDVVFVFPRDLRSRLVGRSVKNWVLQKAQLAWRWISYLMRIFFGIFLLFSIVIVLLAIIVLVFIAKSQTSDRSHGSSSHSFRIMPRPHYHDGSFYGIRPLGLNDIFWIIFWQEQYGRSYRRVNLMHPISRSDPPPRPPNPDRANLESGTEERKDEMHILEAIFSFLFGDGNPNADMERKRMKAIAALIRKNNGVVIAEQIKPYLDSCLLGYKEEYSQHEGFMLPIVRSLDGTIAASDEGEAVYIFPHLKAIAKRNEPGSGVLDREEDDEDIQLVDQEQPEEVIPPPLYEEPWVFSKASDYQISIAIGLGLLNLFECFLVRLLLTGQIDSGFDINELGFIVVFVHNMFYVLLFYALAYLMVPICRYMWIVWMNNRIVSRNQQRRSQVAVLLQDLVKHASKLEFAKAHMMHMKIHPQDTVFTSSSAYPELELKSFQSEDMINNLK